MIQATEAVKLLLGIGEPLIGRLLTYDALGMRFREVRLRRDPKCPLCGTSPTIKDLSIHRPGADGCRCGGRERYGRTRSRRDSRAGGRLRQGHRRRRDTPRQRPIFPRSSSNDSRRAT